MSGKASAVLWLGILLIAAQFFFGGQFHILFQNITATGPKNSPSKNNPFKPLLPTGPLKGGINGASG